MRLVEIRPPTVDLIIYGITLLIATFGGAYIVAKVTGRIVDRMSARMNIRPTIRGAVKTVAMIFILAIAVVTAISQFGVIRLEVVYILLVASLGAAILAFRGVLENLAAYYGIVMAIPIARGQNIEIDGVFGEVRNMGALFTEIRDESGRSHFVPNAVFLRKLTTAYGSGSLTEVKVKVNLPARRDPGKAEAIISRVLADDKELTRPPDPQVLVTKLDESRLELTVKAYVTNPLKRDFVASELRKRIRSALLKSRIRTS